MELMHYFDWTGQETIFSTLNTHDVTDDKTSWKTVELLLTDNFKNKSKINLIENNSKIIQPNRVKK